MGIEGQTASTDPPRGGGGAAGRSGGGTTSLPETPQDRDARRARWGRYWAMMAKAEARNPRTLRRYEAEKREKHVQQ